MTLVLYILIPMAGLAFLVALSLKSQRYGLGRRTTLVAVVLALLGVWLTIDGSLALIEGFQSRNWPIVPGVVVESRVEGTRAFHPEIVYEYTVDSTKYRDSTTLQQPSFGGRTRRKEEADVETGLYKTGEEVASLYNPDDPAVSYLGRNIHWSVYGRTGTGAVLFGVGLCFLFLVGFGRRAAVRPDS